MKKRYETVFILTPVLSETQVKEAVQDYENFLKENSCNITHKSNWGLRQLAYPIQKKSTGFYVLLEFEIEDGSFIEVLETKFKRDEKIMRFLSVKMDKHAIAFAESHRK